MNEILRTSALFIFAGLAEIGGGWLIWQAIREGKPFSWGLLGGIVLVFYGIIPTLQREAAFGRIYAAYGGIFIVLSLLWAWRVDGWQPDRYDLLGALIALVGVIIIMRPR